MAAVLLSMLWLVCWSLSGQTNERRTAQVTLELTKGEEWTAIDAGTVLNAGDKVRFRFRASFDGVLYVLNQTSSGGFLWIFPTVETGTENLIVAGREYTVPATDGAFRIPAAAGYDTLYWIVTPVGLPALPGLSTFPARNTRKPLRPRCDPGPLRARGVCLDRTAGPGSAKDPDGVLEALVSRELVSRDVEVTSRNLSKEISSRAARSE